MLLLQLKLSLRISRCLLLMDSGQEKSSRMQNNSWARRMRRGLGVHLWPPFLFLEFPGDGSSVESIGSFSGVKELDFVCVGCWWALHASGGLQNMADGPSWLLMTAPFWFSLEKRILFWRVWTTHSRFLAKILPPLKYDVHRLVLLYVYTYIWLKQSNS